MREQRSRLSNASTVAGPIDYMLRRWDRFTRFLDDGRICLTNNAAERALRGFALGRKSWLFAGSERGADRAAVIATLIMTALCRAPNYAERLWNYARSSANLRAVERTFSCSIRHSLVAHSASRKASRRSLGRKRVRLPRSYGFSFARATSLSARWACR